MQTYYINGVYRFTEWFTRFVYLNLLWLLFTLMGVILFGVFPATNAVFAITRKWNMGEDVPIFKTFLAIYKREFGKSNLIGYILLVIGVLLKYDIQIFHNIVLKSLAVFFYFVYLLIIVYVGPVFAHYNTTVGKQLKFSFLIAVTNPFKSIVMVSTVVGLIYFFLSFIKLIPFFSISITAFLLTYISHKAFPEGGK